ncbi:class I SAM-dependent methyltransferase [Gammaproteobacteria bacterium]|nr:class I SAM-dependent methyltransferase [Gammaproteobacteria bacterium]
MSPNKKIDTDIANYYSNKILTHGNSPQGVDWNGEESQVLRFKQLSKVIKDRPTFSLLDYGCGYAAYLDFLSKKFKSFKYYGFDLSPEMIQASRERIHDASDCSFSSSIENIPMVDYVVASGIFNVKLDNNSSKWREYTLSILNKINSLSTKGFSFNCLTSYSDQSKKRDDLYYADPLFFFDYCKNSFSKRITLIHDYDLYEFTILVKKE